MTVPRLARRRRARIGAALALGLLAPWGAAGPALASATDGGRPSLGPVPALAPPTPVAPSPGIDQDRFGGRQPDAAYGAFQRGLYVTALNLARPRAENGDPAAQTLMAEILSRGLGVPRDLKAAADWYGKAAAQGLPDAQFQYALMLLDGEFIPRDRARATALMQTAAQAGNRFAEFNYAQMLVAAEPGLPGLSKAAPFYRDAAERGVADAQYAMAQLLAEGTGGLPQDLPQARHWLLLAAKQSFDTAELDLGTWLVEGRGGLKDERAGFNWLRRAARDGNFAAMVRTAKLLLAGLGTDPDNVEAAAWYFLARRAGLQDATMEDHLRGLTPAEQMRALERANRLR